VTDSATTLQEPARVQEVAVAQRRLLLGLLANIVVNVLVRATTGPVFVVVALLGLATVVYTIVLVVQLCKALGKTPWLYAIAVLIPLIGLLVLVMLNQQATTYLKANGVKVGFLGSKA
jgi:hypothetical protein